jgi:hypothetical protein
MDFRETSCEYLSCDDHATFYTSEAKWIRKIKALQKEYPNEVTITKEYPDSIGVHIPKSWFKITPPRKMTLTEEQRAAAAERMSNARKNKKGAK